MSDSSLHTWRTCCPEHVKRSMRRLGAPPSMSCKVIVSPTVFSVWDGSLAEGPARRTRLGHLHRCSCRAAQPCVHVLFVLTVYYRMDETSCLLWQNGIRELQLYEMARAPRLEDVCRLCRDRVDGSHICCPRCGSRFHALCCRLRARARAPREAGAAKGGVANLPWCCEQEIARRSSGAAGPNIERCMVCRSTLTSGWRCCLCPAWVVCVRCCDEEVGHRHDGRSGGKPRRHVHPLVRFVCDDKRAKNHHAGGVRRERGSALTAQHTAEQRALGLQSREIVPEDYDVLLALDVGCAAKSNSVLTRSEFAELPLRVWPPFVRHAGEHPSTSPVRAGWEVGVEQRDCGAMCVICQEPFVSGESVTLLPCAHCFHARCARQWLTTVNATCPIDHAGVKGG